LVLNRGNRNFSRLLRCNWLHLIGNSLLLIWYLCHWLLIHGLALFLGLLYMGLYYWFLFMLIDHFFLNWLLNVFWLLILNILI
jgi:hypothetical protein